MTQAKNTALPQALEDETSSETASEEKRGAAREARLEAVRQLILNAKPVTLEDIEKAESADLRDPYLTKPELESIHALVAFVASNRGVSEDTVIFEAQSKFGLSDITKMRHRDYMDVVQHLVDACDEERMTAN